MRIAIETERLFLRNLVPEDAEAAFQWCGDPKVNKYMIYTLYNNAEDVRTWIESLNPDAQESCDAGFVLKKTGELIGSGGLYYKADRDVWTIGYNLRADMWGNGYTLEAIRALLEYISTIHPIKAIEGAFAVENHNSRRVMEKLGMVYDRDAEYEKMDGSVHFSAKVYRKEIR